MITKIEIDCETIGELLTHLYVLKCQIKGATKDQNLDLTDEIEIELSDDNCYGSHVAEIRAGDSIL